ncbi:MAG: GIY-YIG nuclease family protein [Cyclobacteriaceae bacterium]
MIRGGSVYIITNKSRTTIYTGSTANLQARLIEHKEKYNPASFSARYNLNMLIYYENFHNIEEAIERERYIKGKTRKWKEELIESTNPTWSDLSDEVWNGELQIRDSSATPAFAEAATRRLAQRGAARFKN